MWSHGNNISWKGKIYSNLETKFGVFNNLKVFKALVENQILKCINVIRCDGNWEYNSKNFNAFYKENGIVKQIITPYTPK
jgi:hypothetical protein